MALAEELHAAHEKGIVHLDLKPGNLIIGDGRRLKALDFGLAKFRKPQEERLGDSEAPAEVLRIQSRPDSMRRAPDVARLLLLKSLQAMVSALSTEN